MSDYRSVRKHYLNRRSECECDSGIIVNAASDGTIKAVGGIGRSGLYALGSSNMVEYCGCGRHT